MTSRLLGAASKVGVAFSPAGLLTPYHLGAASELARLNIIHPHTAISGASGGALAAVLSSLGTISSQDSLEACTYISERCRSVGYTRKTLRLALDQMLMDLLPTDAYEKLNQRPGNCTVAYREIFPTMTSHLVTEYQSNDDLIDVLRASCNIPFYFNGNSATVAVRGHFAVDGFFAVERSRFGCPRTEATRELIICPFNPDLIGLEPYSADRRLPHSVGLTLPKKAFVAAFPFLKQCPSQWGGGGDDSAIIHSAAPSSPSSTIAKTSNLSADGTDRGGTTTGNPSPPIYEILSPALLEKDQFPFTLSDLMQIALAPPPVRLGKSSLVYQTLFDCGVETVKKWAATTNCLKEYQQTAEQTKATVI